AQEIYDTYIAPIIEKAKSWVIGITANIVGADKLDSIKKTWKDIKTGKKKLSISFSGGTALSMLNKIKSVWNSISEKAKKISITFSDSFTGPLKSAWNGLANKINSLIPTINKIPGVNITAKVPTFATGGFPEDGWFRASQGEIMGRFDNGQSVVANNNQITDGIASAVYRGNQQEIAILRQQNALLSQIITEIVNKETGVSNKDIISTVKTYNDRYKQVNGKPAFQ
ncbi:MAG: hypothetical protein KBT03_07950, partial [Bacteroidales bacterium]|nr:hypothetical protein [Candidatus Scybalousia scybalohippi]